MRPTNFSTRHVLSVPHSLRGNIDPYLPNASLPIHQPNRTIPFVTLTYACSMDSMISITPGQPTPISGPESKAMTHYLRSRHDAIVVGVGTAIADDPTLNSRLDDIAADGIQRQPRPIVLDRNARWEFTTDSNVLAAAKQGKGKAPWIMVDARMQEHVTPAQEQTLHDCGGKYIWCPPDSTFLELLYQQHICSVMIEGGAFVINDMLSNHRTSIDSIIVTVAPKLFGQGGVHVSPQRREGDTQRPALQFANVKWIPLNQDVVMCGKLAKA